MQGMYGALSNRGMYYIDIRLPDGNECECITYDHGHPEATKTGYEP